MDQNVNLKPCPFCGGVAKLRSTKEIATVICSVCGSWTKLFINYPGTNQDHAEQAIAAWNKRVSDQTAE